jgi:hypothetical protein
LVEKRYAICAKIVESLFDPAYNSAVPNEELWDPETRQELAQAFYDGPEHLIYEFATAYREKSAIGICVNAKSWLEHFRAHPFRQQSERIAAVLPVLKGEMEDELRMYQTTHTGFDSLNMPIWVMVFQDMEHHFPDPSDLIHDRIDEFQDCFELIYRQLRNGRRGTMVFKDGRAFTSGLRKVTSLAFAESDTPTADSRSRLHRSFDARVRLARVRQSCYRREPRKSNLP